MAKVLVAYASRLGGTRGIAEAIGSRLKERGHTAVVRSVSEIEHVDEFHAIVLGSGVFAGHWHKPAVEFARRHDAVLRSRPVWLFSSGPVGDLKIAGPLADPKDVGPIRNRIRPRDHRVFWGALDRAALDSSDLGAMSRFISRRFIPEGDWRDWPAIDAWTDGIARSIDEVAAIPA
jgi:menaquinone-dependent protoporphyrinogen oxidase